jgi:hypothetical protein
MKERCPDITDEGLLYVNEIIKSTYDLRQRDIDALAAIIDKHGICADCGSMFSHWLNEPMASCGCKQSEWGGAAMTPYMLMEQRLETATADRTVLAAQVEVLKNMLIHGYKLDLQMRGVGELKIPEFILNFEKELPTPAACLAQVRAEAFVLGATMVSDNCSNCADQWSEKDILDAANERIRQGVTE